MGVQMMGKSIPGVQLDSTLEFFFCSVPVPIRLVLHLGGRDMSVAYCVVQCQGLGGGCSGERNADLRINSRVPRDVSLGQASVGKSVAGVFLYRLVETLACLPPCVLRPALQV